MYAQVLGISLNHRHAMLSILGVQSGVYLYGFWLVHCTIDIRILKCNIILNTDVSKHVKYSLSKNTFRSSRLGSFCIFLL